ncbi:A KINASE (PRKA) ANCHOR PROTEIN 17A, partial [Salix purpurea]
MSSSFRPLETISPTGTLEIENGLSLVPRVKLNLTVYPSIPSSATKPIDEWKLKRSLIEFAKTSLSITITEDDLDIKRFKDVKKRKRDDPVAHGSLSIRDLGFLNSKKRNEEESEDLKILGKKFRDWRDNVVEKMDQMEVNLQGEKYRLSVAVPESDDFEEMKKSWEDFFAFANKGYVRGGRQEPDTIVMKGVPSRWVAEPRVSSKPSMLVTHTVFSTFGKIRNLNVAEDDDQDKDADENGGDIISGLHCKIVVQFEKHRDFYNALKVLCGRSLQK